MNKQKLVNLASKAKLALSVALLSASVNVLAALPADVDTSLSATQADVVAMIGKGFAYLGVTAGLMVVLAVFVKIIRKGKG